MTFLKSFSRFKRDFFPSWVQKPLNLQAIAVRVASEEVEYLEFRAFSGRAVALNPLQRQLLITELNLVSDQREDDALGFLQRFHRFAETPISGTCHAKDQARVLVQRQFEA